MIPSETLAKWRAIANAATKGPWRWLTGGNIQPSQVETCEGDYPGDGVFVAQAFGAGAEPPQQDNNAAFIAESRTALPALLDEVELLRRESESLRGLVTAVATWRCGHNPNPSMEKFAVDVDLARAFDRYEAEESRLRSIAPMAQAVSNPLADAGEGWRMASEWIAKCVEELDCCCSLDHAGNRAACMRSVISRHADAELARLRDAARPIAEAIKKRVAQAEDVADGRVVSVTVPQINRSEWEAFLAIFAVPEEGE